MYLGEKRKMITLKIPNNVMEKLEEFADQRGLTINNLIIFILDEYVP